MVNHPGTSISEEAESKHAWLLYWEQVGEHVTVRRRLAAVMNYRYSAEAVCRIVETIFAEHSYTAVEQLLFAMHSGRNPYRARRERIKGVMLDRIFCGHDPVLVAERAYDLRAVRSYDSAERLTFRTRRISVQFDNLGPAVQYEWVNRELAITADTGLFSCEPSLE